MNISAKSKYAVRALVELAQQNNGHPIPIADIASRRDIPLQFLEQLFSTLRKAGILNSHRGVRGGFSFNRLPEDVTVLDVVEVLDGNISPAACTSGASCERIDGCIMNEVWGEVKSSIEEVLTSHNIGELASRESLMESKSREMYYI
ncbi:MAG: Rrf2 family transcriptional regulator [Gaiellales bacterium]|nr:MAG: Rrf2 family transcriptional regulator [Gaiellales bacterium]